MNESPPCLPLVTVSPRFKKSSESSMFPRRGGNCFHLSSQQRIFQRIVLPFGREYGLNAVEKKKKVVARIKWIYQSVCTSAHVYTRADR